MKKRFAAAAGSGSGFRRSLGALALMLTCVIVFPFYNSKFTFYLCYI